MSAFFGIVLGFCCKALNWTSLKWQPPTAAASIHFKMLRENHTFRHLSRGLFCFVLCSKVWPFSRFTLNLSRQRVVIVQFFCSNAHTVSILVKGKSKYLLQKKQWDFQVLLSSPKAPGFSCIRYSSIKYVLNQFSSYNFHIVNLIVI